MNGHHQAQAPLAMLWTHDAHGNEAPAFHAFDSHGKLCKIAYTPWSDGPQLPWDSFSTPNEDWLALHQGDATIELQPGVDPTAPTRYGKDPMGHAVPPLDHTNVTLVRNDLYRKRDDDNEPTQDVGTTSQCFIGSRSIINRQNWVRPRALLSYVEVPSPDADFSLGAGTPGNPSPLSIAPTQLAIDDPPIGGIVSIAQLTFGHLGVGFTALYDVPPGQIVRIPVGASFVSNDGMLAPKYYKPDAVGEPVTGFRQYDLFPGGPILTTAHWNTLTQDILPKNLVGAITSTPAVFQGWVAAAQTFNTDLTRPTRRFYGSCFCTGTPPNPFSNPIVNPAQVTVCPIAWWSSQVTLVANAGLNFAIRGQTTAAGTQFWGPFPANQPINMPAGATSIIVFQVVSLAQPGVARIEELFELLFVASYA